MHHNSFNTNTPPIRILGLDPGTATTGWAIIEHLHGLSKPIAYGHIETQPNLSNAQRLEEIANDLVQIIEEHRPIESAIESLFFFKNQKTIITVAQARGACLLTLQVNKLKIAEYTPLQVKQALTGYGRAEKKQIQHMVTTMLGLHEIPKPDDTADAIAIALTHARSRMAPLAQFNNVKRPNQTNHPYI